MGKSSPEWDELDTLRGSMQNLIKVLERSFSLSAPQGGQRPLPELTAGLDVEWWDGRVEEAASAQHRREVREQATAVRQKLPRYQLIPQLYLTGCLRETLTCAAWAVGRRCAVVASRGATEGEVER